MTQEEKLEEAKRLYETANADQKHVLESLFPELKESEDEQHRKWILEYLYDGLRKSDEQFKGQFKAAIAWLEKQGEPKSYWKPSKDEMDALYGLAYITNTMDDKKDEAVTKLYQDLKREFFNGASYENMFPSSPVDAQTKEEKQDEQNPKFRVGDTIKCKYDDRQFTIKSVDLDEGTYTYTQEGCGNDIDYADEMFELVEQKPAWSEEDKMMLQYAIEHFERQKRNCVEGGGRKKVMQEFIDWLKSLKPQNTWKPSIAQLNALSIVSKGNAPDDIEAIVSLYQDLKKLREK